MPQTRNTKLFDIATSDAAVTGWVAASVIAVASLLGVYAATSQSSLKESKGADSQRPKPVWMALKPVRAQMADGDMLLIKVSLQLSKTKSADELTDYAGVFNALVEETGQHTTRKNLKAPDGIERFGIQIQRDLNDYLEDRDATPSRITSVMFDELVPLPR